MRLDQAGRGYVELEPYGTIRPMVRNLLIFTVGAFFFIRVLGIEGWLALSARVLSFLGGELELLNPGQPGARFRVRVPVIAEAAARQPLEAHA